MNKYLYYMLFRCTFASLHYFNIFVLRDLYYNTNIGVDNTDYNVVIQFDNLDNNNNNNNNDNYGLMLNEE